METISKSPTAPIVVYIALQLQLIILILRRPLPSEKVFSRCLYNAPEWLIRVEFLLSVGMLSDVGSFDRSSIDFSRITGIW